MSNHCSQVIMQLPLNMLFTTRKSLLGVIHFKRISVKQKKVPKQVNHQSFQESVLFYLNSTEYCKNIFLRLQAPNNQVKRVENLLKNYSSQNNPRSLSVCSDQKFVSKLPSFIFNMNKKRVSKEEIYAADDITADIFDVTKSQATNSTISSVDFLQAWLNALHPDIHHIAQLFCFGKLIKHRCRELLGNSSKELHQSAIPLVYLIFVAGIGKTNTIDSREVLNKLAQFTQAYPELTYENCNEFELAIICESFFKGGMKLDSERFLSHVSTQLCELLSPELPHSNYFNTYIVVSMLKIIRQVNYIEHKVLELLSEFILNPVNERKVRNIGFLTNIVSAFVGPGRRFILSEDLQPGKEKSRQSLLNRVEHLVVDIIGESESIMKSDKKEISKNNEHKDSSTANKTKLEPKDPVGLESAMSRVRLKDISRWLWASSSLGYQISSPKTYERDLSRRFSSGEFFKRSEDAVDSLLALSIMNHYLDDLIVTKILQSPDFRSAIRAKCSLRHRWRFGLYLTSLKIERSNHWGQLDEAVRKELAEIGGPPLAKTEEWNEANFPEKVRRDKRALMSMPEMKNHVTHSELLNQCMTALKRVFNVSGNEDNNNSINGNRSHKNAIGTLKPRPDYQVMEVSNENAVVLHGYAVQYLHIPGIKLMPPNAQKEIYIEVLHEDAISPGLHEFKIRLLRKMGHSVFTVSYEEIRSNKSLEGHFKALLKETGMFSS